MNGEARPIDEMHLHGVPTSVAEARDFARGVLQRAGHGGEVVDEAALLVSELVTNAVTHAAATLVRVRVEVDPTIRVEVEDANRSRPHIQTRQPSEPGGLGLVVVDAIASRWGTDLNPAGKVVWFELDSAG